MSKTFEDIRSFDELRAFVHRTLCEKENLLADEFQMTETQLTRRGRQCGLHFSLHGPRAVRLEAIWASDHNTLYFYGTQGERYQKVQLKHRVNFILTQVENRPAA